MFWRECFSHDWVHKMNFGSARTMEKQRSELRWLALFLAAMGLLPAQALGQDMSFDLDEAENAPAGADAAEEPAEGEGDTAGDEGGGDSGEGGLFDELAADESATTSSDAGEQRAAATVAAEEIYAVQRMYALRNGRFELAPSVAVTVNDQYVSHNAAAIGLNYWISNVLAVGVNFLWYQGLENSSFLNFSVQRSFRLGVPITEYQLGSHLNFTYVPIYGKFSMFNDYIFQWDSYLVGGVGLLRTRPVAVVDPNVRTFDFDWRLAFNAGIGIRVFVTRYLTVFTELRDYMYLERLENLSVSLEGRDEPATWISDSATLTHNVAVHLGVTMFFPFTFEYRYPK